MEIDLNTPGGKLFFVKKQKLQFFLYVSSSYAKILGETNFQTQEFLRSGGKTEGRVDQPNMKAGSVRFN